MMIHILTLDRVAIKSSTTTEKGRQGADITVGDPASLMQ